MKRPKPKRLRPELAGQTAGQAWGPPRQLLSRWPGLGHGPAVSSSTGGSGSGSGGGSGSNAGSLRHHESLGLVAGNVRTIDSFYLNMDCALCGSLCKSGVCNSCAHDPQSLMIAITHRTRVARKTYEVLGQRHGAALHHLTSFAIQRALVACRSCSGLAGHQYVPCESLDCPILFDRIRAQDRWEDAQQLQDAVDKMLAPSVAAATAGIPMAALPDALNTPQQAPSARTDYHVPVLAGDEGATIAVCSSDSDDDS